ncbi:Ig-like domain-containing protein [Vibrio sp. 10N.261.51.C6]|uniref:Ig-like domain-containing protein n=1 Tax=Vibrio sp. 10N.261.51.C6 TaxID=3229676 RepID=UPI00354F88E3
MTKSTVPKSTKALLSAALLILGGCNSGDGEQSTNNEQLPEEQAYVNASAAYLSTPIGESSEIDLTAYVDSSAPTTILDVAPLTDLDECATAVSSYDGLLIYTDFSQAIGCSYAYTVSSGEITSSNTIQVNASSSIAGVPPFFETIHVNGSLGGQDITINLEEEIGKHGTFGSILSLEMASDVTQNNTIASVGIDENEITIVPGTSSGVGIVHYSLRGSSQNNNEIVISGEIRVAISVGSNNPPTASDDSIGAEVYQEFTYKPTVTEIDGDSWYISEVNSDPYTEVSVSAMQEISYKVTHPTSHGVITYTVTDGQGGYDTATLTIAPQSKVKPYSFSKNGVDYILMPPPLLSQHIEAGFNNNEKTLGDDNYIFGAFVEYTPDEAYAYCEAIYPGTTMLTADNGDMALVQEQIQNSYLDHEHLGWEWADSYAAVSKTSTNKPLYLNVSDGTTTSNYNPRPALCVKRYVDLPPVITTPSRITQDIYKPFEISLTVDNDNGQTSKVVDAIYPKSFQEGALSGNDVSGVVGYEAGDHEIMILVADEAGNTSWVTQEVTLTRPDDYELTTDIYLHPTLTEYEAKEKGYNFSEAPVAQNGVAYAVIPSTEAKHYCNSLGLSILDLKSYESWEDQTQNSLATYEMNHYTFLWDGYTYIKEIRNDTSEIAYGDGQSTVTCSGTPDWHIDVSTNPQATPGIPENISVTALGENGFSYDVTQKGALSCSPNCDISGNTITYKAPGQHRVTWDGFEQRAETVVDVLPRPDSIYDVVVKMSTVAWVEPHTGSGGSNYLSVWAGYGQQDSQVEYSIKMSRNDYDTWSEGVEEGYNTNIDLKTKARFYDSVFKYAHFGDFIITPYTSWTCDQSTCTTGPVDGNPSNVNVGNHSHDTRNDGGYYFVLGSEGNTTDTYVTFGKYWRDYPKDDWHTDTFEQSHTIDLGKQNP